MPRFLLRSRVPALILLAVILISAGVPAPALNGGMPGLRASLAYGGRAGMLPLTAMPTPRQAFEQLQARAAGAIDAYWDSRSGVPEYLSMSDPALRLPYTPAAAERGDPVAIARGFLDENRALFGLTAVAADLRLLRVEPDPQRNYSHIRFEQTYQGLPVYGRQLVVHIDAAEQIVAVNGQVTGLIDIPAEATVSAERAIEVALAEVLDIQLEPDERARVTTEVLPERTGLLVYVDAAGKATLAWRVVILTHAPLGQWYVFVNARRPAVIHALDTLGHAKLRRTYSARNTTRIPGQLVIEEGERSSRNAIAQAAHDAAGVVYDYYFNTHQRDSIDGRGMAIVSTVNYGNDPADAENAAWISEAAQMIYGDGGNLFRPLVYGLDVVGHELTHGVIDHTAQLIYEGQSGALNESYADVFGVLVDRGNWTVGEQIVNSPPFPVPYLRDMQDPTLGGRYNPRRPLDGVGQPGHMRDFAKLPLSRRSDNGGVHINSGIPNRAAYLVAQALGVEKMERIYYRAMTQYLTPDSDFADATRLTIRAAQDLYGGTDAAAVRNAFAEVGLTTAGADVGPAPEAPPSSLPTGPAQAPTQQTPAGCSELIVNGGFEANQGWVEVTLGETAIIDPELPYTGARSAWLGGVDTEALQYIYQDVRIPANATSVQLSYYRLVHEEFRGVLGILAADASFGTLFANTSGDVLGAVEEIASSEGDDTWRQVSFDVTELAGKRVRLTFISNNPPGNVSSMWVDDVSLLACTTGAAPQAPSAAGDQVFIQGTLTDADTGRGVSGAQVFILRPGISASQAAADDNLTSREVLTVGVSDKRGVYQTEAPVPRGQVYSVIVIARGYRPIVADDALTVPRNASNPYRADADLRKSR